MLVRASRVRWKRSSTASLEVKRLELDKIGLGYTFLVIAASVCPSSSVCPYVCPFLYLSICSSVHPSVRPSDLPSESNKNCYFDHKYNYGLVVNHNDRVNPSRRSRRFTFLSWLSQRAADIESSFRMSFSAVTLWAQRPTHQEIITHIDFTFTLWTKNLAH